MTANLLYVGTSRSIVRRNERPAFLALIKKSFEIGFIFVFVFLKNAAARSGGQDLCTDLQTLPPYRFSVFTFPPPPRVLINKQ